MILMIGIRHPFPHVAVHVIQAEPVWRKTPHIRRLAAKNADVAIAINKLAIIIRLIRADRLAKRKRRGRSGAAGIFPFRFGRQARRQPPEISKTSECFKKFLRVIP